MIERYSRSTVSLDPPDFVAFYVVSIVVPLLILRDGFAAARGRPRWIGADLWALIALSAYGIAVSSLVDLGENMRFRLTFEPVLLCTSALALLSLGWQASLLGLGLGFGQDDVMSRRLPRRPRTPDRATCSRVPP